MLCSANGILFGMDTGVIGPVTDMKDFKASFGGSQNATIHGLIVSSILIPAALSSFFAGHLADKLGRPKGISIGVFIFGVGAAIEAAAVRLGMFICGRIVEGLGEGLFLGMIIMMMNGQSRFAQNLTFVQAHLWSISLKSHPRAPAAH